MKVKVWQYMIHHLDEVIAKTRVISMTNSYQSLTCIWHVTWTLFFGVVIELESSLKSDHSVKSLVWFLSCFIYCKSVTIMRFSCHCSSVYQRRIISVNLHTRSFLQFKISVRFPSCCWCFFCSYLKDKQMVPIKDFWKFYDQTRT